MRPSARLALRERRLARCTPPLRAVRSALLLRAGGDREERRYLRLCAAWNFTGIRGAVRGEGCAFIDLGADFRLKEESDYAQWYGGAYTHQELHSQAVYALPELFRAEIQKGPNPCKPWLLPHQRGTGACAGSAGRLIEPQGIVIDSKSGVTGSGRSPSETAHFPNCNEAFSLIRLRRTAIRRRSSRRSPTWPVKSSRLCLCRTCCRSTGGLSLRCMPA